MGVIFRNSFKGNFDFGNEEYNPMPNGNPENENEIYPYISEVPGTHLDRDNKVDVIMDPQNDEVLNIKAAEAERNCDLGEIPVTNSREPDEQNDKVLLETDVDDPD